MLYFCNVKNRAMETRRGGGRCGGFCRTGRRRPTRGAVDPDSADPAANAAAWKPIVADCNAIHTRANSLPPLGAQPTPMHSMYTAGDGGADVFSGVSATGLVLGFSAPTGRVCPRAAPPVS